MRRDREKGAIVVEATISLTAFVFAIFTILFVINIAYIQAKMSVSLNTAAKEISQYSFFYYKSGLSDVDKETSGDTADERQLVNDTVNGVGEFITAISDIPSHIDTGDIEGMVTQIENGAENVDQLVSQYADKIADDPKGFIMGMGKMAAVELGQQGKAILGQVLAKAMMKKNLKAYEGDDPDKFLRRHNVVGGMDGLNFDHTTLMAYGEDQIQLVVKYDVKVIQLLNVDFNFTFWQAAQTRPWGDGVSVINKTSTSSGTSSEKQEKSIWNGSDTLRGDEIVLKEKKNNYPYSGDKYFDAYNYSENEFVSIISINTFKDSYQSSGPIKQKIKTAYQNMETNVKSMDESIKVKNNAGDGTLNLVSDKETRKYKVVVVVPENADMTMIDKAVSDFRENWEGYPVTVEVKKGYGNYEEPTPPPDDSGNTQTPQN